MRDDIYSILNHISLEETLSVYGEPINNSSKVIVKCSNCLFQSSSTILVLKNRLRRVSCILCNKCIGKLSWTDSKREAIGNFWTIERRQEQAHRTSAMFNDESYKESHRNGIHKSITPELRARLSQSSTRVWENPEYRANQSKSTKLLWKDPDYQQKQSEFRTEDYRSRASEVQAKIGEDPQYKKMMADHTSSMWKDRALRERRVKSLESVWERPGYKKRQSARQKEMWTNQDYRRAFEELWSDPEYKKRISELVKLAFQNEDVRKKASEASKRRWQSESYRSKISSAVKALWNDQSYRNVRTQQSREMWKDLDFKKKMAGIRSAQSDRMSSIEAITSSILDSIGIKYLFNHPFGPYLFDFFIPNMNIFIECQGEYWHSLPGRAERDAGKLTYLESASPSSKILYLLERDFLNPSFVASKVSRFIFNEAYSFPQADFEMKSISVQSISKNEYLPFLQSFHYASHGRLSKKAYGAFLDNRIIAVCKFSSLLRQEMATSMNLNPAESIELDRFCIHPSFHKKNFASWFLSRSTKAFMKANVSVNTIMTFSDMTYGHSGIIYSAAGWKSVGNIRPDYVYINEDGNMMHKKTLYNRAVRMGVTESEYAIKHGFTKSIGRSKTKFILQRRV